MEEELEGLYQAMRCERDKLRKELEQTQRAAQRSEEILTEENAELREKLAKAEKEKSMAFASLRFAMPNFGSEGATTPAAPPKVTSRHFGQTFLSVQLSCGHSRSYKAPPLPEVGETVACYECEVAHLKTQETPAVEDEGGKAAKPKRYFANQCPDCGHCDCSQHFDEDSGTFFTCCSCGTSFSYPNPPVSPSLPSPSATEGGESR